MAGRLAGKVIVVAGAGTIGGGLARRYVEEGAQVVLGDLRGEKAIEQAREVDPSGERIVGTTLDGADEDSVQAIVDLALARFGGLSGFHANFASFADTQMKNGVIDLPLSVWDESMRVNARGFVICTQKALPPMIAGGGGSIVYTSSADAFRGAPVRVAYQMSKASIHALMRHTASRYGRKGVRANVVSPGLVLNPSGASGMPPAMLQLLKDDTDRHTVLPGRFGAPEDIANAAVLLLSDEGRYITGQIINVDGGLTMRN